MTCHYCGRAENFPAAPGSKQVELRPYGPGGSDVCFECATSSPEREKQTERAFGTILQGNEAISPVGIAAITDKGLIPFDPEMPKGAPDAK